MNFFRLTVTSLLIFGAMTLSAGNKSDSKEDTKDIRTFKVLKENPVTSVKDQHRSGTCWCFSALSFIESEIMKAKGISDIDLSEM